MPLTRTLSVLVYIPVTGMYTSTGQVCMHTAFQLYILLRSKWAVHAKAAACVWGVRPPCTGAASRVPCVWPASVPAVCMQMTASNLDAQS